MHYSRDLFKNGQFFDAHGAFSTLSGRVSALFWTRRAAGRQPSEYTRDLRLIGSRVACFHDGRQHCGGMETLEDTRRADALPLAVGLMEVAWRAARYRRSASVRISETAGECASVSSGPLARLNPSPRSVDDGRADFSARIIGNPPI